MQEFVLRVIQERPCVMKDFSFKVLTQDCMKQKKIHELLEQRIPCIF